MIQKTEAVVLKTLNHGDTSKIITLYSRDMGRLKLIAKGIRSPKSKAAGLFQPTRHLQVVYYEKANKELQLFKSGELINGFFGLENDFDRLTLAQVVVELVERSVEDEEPHPALFDLLVDTLTHLSNKETPSSLAYWHFHLALLTELGYRPHVNQCSECGETFAAEAYLGAQHSQLECTNCHDHSPYSSSVSLDVIRMIQFLLGESWAVDDRPVLNSLGRKELWDFLWKYTFYHIESARNMRSLKVLRQLYG